MKITYKQSRWARRRWLFYFNVFGKETAGELVFQELTERKFNHKKPTE